MTLPARQPEQRPRDERSSALLSLRAPDSRGAFVPFVALRVAALIATAGVAVGKRERERFRKQAQREADALRVQCPPHEWEERTGRRALFVSPSATLDGELVSSLISPPRPEPTPVSDRIAPEQAERMKSWSAQAREQFFVKRAALPTYREVEKRFSGRTPEACWEIFMNEYGPRIDAAGLDRPSGKTVANSLKTLKNWANSTRSDSASPLCGREPRGRKRIEKFPSKFGQFRACLLAMYGDKTRRNFSTADRYAREYCASLAAPVPSPNQAIRWARREWPDWAIAPRRKGKRAAEREYGPHIIRDPEEVRPGERLVTDLHILDFIAHDGAKPRRYCIIGMQDQRSRVMQALYLCDGENAENYLAALKIAIANGGVPNELALDNSKSAHGTALKGARGGDGEARTQSACEKLGIRLRFARPMNPGAKLIERTFGVICEEVSKQFPSYIGGRPDRRPEDFYRELRAGGIEVPHVDEVRVRLEQFRQWYNERPHAGAGMMGRSPMQVFYSENPIPKRTIPPELLDSYFAREYIVTATRKGVVIDGIRYGAHCSSLWSCAGKQVRVERDLCDWGFVNVFELDSDRLIARVDNVPLRGSTPEDHRIARREKKRIDKARRDALAIAPAFMRPTQKIIERVMRDRQQLAAERAEQRQAVGAEAVALPRNLALPQNAQENSEKVKQVRRASRPVGPIFSERLMGAFSALTGSNEAAIDDDLVRSDPEPLPLPFAPRATPAPQPPAELLSDDLDDDWVGGADEPSPPPRVDDSSRGGVA